MPTERSDLSYECAYPPELMPIDFPAENDGSRRFSVQSSRNNQNCKICSIFITSVVTCMLGSYLYFTDNPSSRTWATPVGSLIAASGFLIAFASVVAFLEHNSKRFSSEYTQV